MLAPTPPERLTDSSSHPYFLWDTEMTLDDFRRELASTDPEIRAYHIARLMRQAKPDDVFTFVRLQEIRETWPRLERYLGSSRGFWRWLLDRWEALGVG
jgi:hypothetical protein